MPGSPAHHREKAADLLPGVRLQSQQQRIADTGDEETRKLIYHSLGSGKSLSAIAAAERAGTPYTAIVPAALRPNFRKELAKFTDQTVPANVQSYSALAKEPPEDTETLIFDEAQRLRNPESKQTINAKQLARSARNLYLLSGTPIVNHPSDLAPLIELLTQRPLSPTQFDSKFVGQQRTWPSLSGFLLGARPTATPKIRNRDQLKQLLQGHVDYHASPDLGVEQIDEHYDTPMSSQQTELHRAFWNQLPALLRWKLQRNYPLSKQELANLSSFLSGPRQVSLSTLPFMRGKRDPMFAYQQSPKLQKAVGLLQETLAKDPSARGVVFSNFLEAGLEPYAAALAAAKIPHAMFHGGLSDAQRKQIVDDYNAGRIRTLLLGPSGSEGISLKGTRLIQLLDPHWNQTRLSQAIGRGIRFDSHNDLPPEQRNVRVQRFASQLPAGVGARLWRWLTQTKPTNDRNNPGTDTYLERMSTRKDDINQQFLDLLKEVAGGQQRFCGTASIVRRQ